MCVSFRGNKPPWTFNDPHELSKNNNVSDLKPSATGILHEGLSARSFKEFTCFEKKSKSVFFSFGTRHELFSSQLKERFVRRSVLLLGQLKTSDLAI